MRLPEAPSIAVGHAQAAIASPDGEVRLVDLAKAAAALRERPAMLVHAPVTLRRLGLENLPALDLLELFAFVRPARFCLPTPRGLARALGLPVPADLESEAGMLPEIAGTLLAELGDETELKPHQLRRRRAIASAMAAGGWRWGPAVMEALDGALRPEELDRVHPTSARAQSALSIWEDLPDWAEHAPEPPPGHIGVDPAEARQRLAQLLGEGAEARPQQADYASAASAAFAPREREGEPNFVLAEAGTGVGKTLGYLAPASLWAEANGAAVWVSTYTRALQRQIERESHAIHPDPAIRAKKAVVRKGRENYLCLLNLQDAVQAGQLGNGDLIGLGLVARWARATRDGDMTGGDFPAWLPTLFAVGAQVQAGAPNLVDRRGECIHAGCTHYRTCFVEKAVRASRRADLVIANHALVLTQAAFDGARAARGAKADSESAALKRIVFDEGHHLFDAADAAFSAALSGAEAAELRRWIRGPEGRGRRGRGLEARLAELVAEREDARQALNQAIRAAAALPGEGWSGRIAPPSGEVNPIGPIEGFLVAALEQLRARSEPSEVGQECAARPAIDLVREHARTAAAALAAIEAPLLALARGLEDLLDQEAATLPTPERGRIEGALRGLDRRARMTLPAWRSMLQALDENGEDDPDFVDWLEAVFAFGRVADIAYRRHWVDPTEPLQAAVLAPAHGVLVTSATLTDPALDDPFAIAEMRTGAARLPDRPKTIRLTSPFDYASNARAFVVTDVGREDPRQVAAAMRELFLAAGGGGLGLFTAIRRLRAVHDKIAAPLAEKGLALYAQHVEPLEVGALVDIFRAEENSCLLGTDAVRDGVDVPGRSLRLLVFDRVPWPRPDLLHKARRQRFGGKGYDDGIARARIAQAFGRLIRRADDKGVFVMLDAAAPTRLFSSLPAGIELKRVGLVEAIEATADFLKAN